MRKLIFYTLFSVGISLGLISCLDESDGKNVEYYMQTKAIVGYNQEYNKDYISLLGKSRMEYAIPGSNFSYGVGTCLIADFTVDYDNQPSNKYLTISDTTFSVVPQEKLILAERGTEISEYINPDTIPVNNWASNYSRYQFGRIFSQVEYFGDADQDVKFELVYIPTETEQAGDKSIRKVYLIAKKVGEGDGFKVNNSVLEAFNFNELFKLGYDSIDRESKQSFKYLQLDLRYLKGVDGDNKPKWEYAENTSEKNPLKLLMLASDLNK